MVSDSQPSPPTVRDTALLERARLALQSLQFEEEAARYRVACAELMEAIADAEAGNEIPLKRWLLARRDGKESSLSGQNALAETTESQLSEKTAVTTCTPPRDPSASELRMPVETLSTASLAVESPWNRMAIAADARAKAWLETEQDNEPDSPASSLDIALDKHQLGPAPSKKKKARVIAPHVSVSLIVHGLVLVVLGWWVVTIAQPEKQLFISVGQNDSHEVSLETTLEPAASEMTPSEDLEPAPATTMDTLPIDVPRITAIDSGVGPQALQSHLATAESNGSNVDSMGTNLAAGAEFFGAKAAGNTFLFVVDCSPSMARDKAFESAKAEILRSLSMMKPKQRFFILFFGAEITPIQFPGQDPEPYMLRANPENLGKTIEWIQRIQIQKEGRHPVDAVRQAIEMEPDGIFLLFDGDTKVNQWTERIRDMNRTDDLFSQGETRIPIHVVHFFRDEFTPDMKRLADENQGTYRFVPRPKKGTSR